MICGMFIMTAHLPNMIMVGIFDKAGFSNLNYLNWMLLQAPYLGMFALTQAWIRWHFGTRKVHIAGGVEALRKKYDDLGPMTMPEKVLLGIFALAGIMFMTGKGSFIAELHHQPLGVIGLLGMLVLFAPGLMPCSWKSVQEKTIWGTFLLLGGAMTMTTAMTQSGLAQWLADHIHAWVVGMSWWQAILTMMVGTHIIRLGMLSNVAAVAMLAPVVFAMAPKLGLHPVAFTMLVCDTDTFAYILPTQITAAVIAHGTDTFSSTDYARAGWVSVCIAIAYGLLVMAPWYALWGMPSGTPAPPGPSSPLPTCRGGMAPAPTAFYRRTSWPTSLRRTCASSPLKTWTISRPSSSRPTCSSSAAAMPAASWPRKPPWWTPTSASPSWKRPRSCAPVPVPPVWTPSIPTSPKARPPKTWCAGAVPRWAAAPCVRIWPFPMPASSTSPWTIWNAGACPSCATSRAASATAAKWDISIHGEQLKPIMAEKALESGADVYNRVTATALIMHEGRCTGAMGFGVA